MIKVTLLFLCVGKQETMILQSFEVFKTQTGIPHHNVEAFEELAVEIFSRFLDISLSLSLSSHVRADPIGQGRRVQNITESLR